MTQPTQQALQFGQSLWLDGIDRAWIQNGFLKEMVTIHGVRGLTSNPSIFKQAMTSTSKYDRQMREILSHGAVGVKELYEALAIQDIRDAADLLQTVYDSSGGEDGFISLEVSPSLAHDTNGTLEEARRLWESVNRPNLMIKVPATAEGIPAIKTLIAEGISVNVTLLFSRERYLEAAEAYVSGLEQRLRSGNPIRRVASVASFFVSRIDVAVDKQLDRRIKQNKEAESLLGKIAIANAKNAYADFKSIIASARWRVLSAQGAQAQRLLWASTSTKNPDYRDTVYVEGLIGADTVDTVPLATFKAFEDHGKVRDSLSQGLQDARADLKKLEDLGISLGEITDGLLIDGVKKFSDPFHELMAHLEKKRREFSPQGLPRVNDLSLRILPQWMGSLGDQLRKWREDGSNSKLWKGDASLWTGADEASWVDWLKIVDGQIARLKELKEFSAEVRAAQFTDAVLLGMGGSSLVAEVLANTFNEATGYPDFHILDSTDPTQIAELVEKINLERTLFIVSSKSGSTLEPNLFFEYFYEQLRGEGARAGQHFIAITDPGSKLEKIAQDKNFWRIFHGVPGIGGRYSALSDFGLIPMAVLGIDLEKLLEQARTMRLACEAEVPAEINPGVVLGAALGSFALHGRNKVTFVASPEISNLGPWLEQLLAESTGKQGRGLIPIVDEQLGLVSSYGNDRVFVHLDYLDGDNREVSNRLDELERDGHPVIRVSVSERYGIAQEFYRWEIATAVVGAILHINPFNQPDVEASKVETRRLTEEFEKNGKFPDETPFYDDGEIQLFAGDQGRSLSSDINSFKKDAEKTRLEDFLKAHLERLRAGDYFAILAYLPTDPAVDSVLEEFRDEVRRRFKVATCLGYGPRFLHSTGQVYKGGPNQGVFIQITTAHEKDLSLPTHRFGFELVELAQAKGDLEVLESRKRRVMRIHLLGKSSAERVKQLARLKEILGSLKTQEAA